MVIVILTFAIGTGTKMRGSQHNDPFVLKTGSSGKKWLGTSSNNSGGVQGGIANGEPIIFKVPMLFSESAQPSKT